MSAWILFLVISYLNFKEVKKIFSLYLELPKAKWISLGLFTLFFAIPARAYINNQFGLLGKFVVWVIILFFAEIYPVGYILVALKWIFILEVYLFLNFYLNFSKMRTFFDSFLFNKNEELSKSYMLFFFGNPMSKVKQIVASGVGGWALREAYVQRKQNEHLHVINKVKEETTLIGNQLAKHGKPPNIPEVFEIRQKVREEVIENETFILKVEKSFDYLLTLIKEYPKM
jgi:hypothetical protein